MLRRDARLRKEYLYRKSLEEKEVRQYEKKMALKSSLERNTAISGEIKRESMELAKQLTYDEGLSGLNILFTVKLFT